MRGINIISDNWHIFRYVVVLSESELNYCELKSAMIFINNLLILSVNVKVMTMFN